MVSQAFASNLETLVKDSQVCFIALKHIGTEVTMAVCVRTLTSQFCYLQLLDPTMIILLQTTTRMIP
jgi:hypothetical protein